MRFLAVAFLVLLGHDQQRPVETNPTTPTFEVASIKPNDAGESSYSFSILPSGRFVATNVSLKALMVLAYGIRPDRIVGGPSWIQWAGFDIEAKPEDRDGTPVSNDESRAMLRALLADRFKLLLRSESRDVRVYSLDLARGDRRPGLQLRPSQATCVADVLATGSDPTPTLTPHDPTQCGMFLDKGSLVGRGQPIAALILSLTHILKAQVVDRTELTGPFDFRLTWYPDETVAVTELPTSQTNGDPSFLTAVRDQLGLKVTPQDSPSEVLVIEGAEWPTPNPR
jgi:bla regulator protein BlaR1